MLRQGSWQVPAWSNRELWLRANKQTEVGRDGEKVNTHRIHRHKDTTTGVQMNFLLQEEEACLALRNGGQNRQNLRSPFNGEDAHTD